MHRPLALLVSSLVLAAPLHARELQYRVRDLGQVGSLSTSAYDINDAGQVVYCGTASSSGPSAVLWNSDGTRVPIPALGYGAAPWFLSSTGARVLSINEEGMVAGTSGTSPSNIHAGVWTAGGGTQLIAEPIRYDTSQGADVNDSGVVAGTAGTTYLLYPPLESALGCAFRWTAADGFTMLQCPPGFTVVSTFARAINSAGIVVGGSRSSMSPWDPRKAPRSSSPHICVWDASGNATDLSASTGVSGEARDISDSGWIVGACGQSGTWTRLTNAFLWTQDGGLVELWAGSANGVNEGGLVVGQMAASSPYGTGACVWSQETGPVLLPSLSGSISTVAYAVNSSGVIVGTSNGHAVIWEPVPEPGCLVTLVAGAAGLALHRRRLARRSSAD